MYLLRGLKPDFGYFCLPPNLRRKLSLALAFTIFGLVACASGLALLVDDDPNPRSAFALAPLQSPSRAPATLATTAELPPANAILTKADRIKSCQRNAVSDDDANCDAGAARKPGVVPAVTDPPAAAELPIGHGSEPAAGAPATAALVASPSPLNAAVPEPVDVLAPPASLAEAPAPEASGAKPRKTARHHSSRRYSYDDSYRRSYARPHFLPFFW